VSKWILEKTCSSAVSIVCVGSSSEVGNESQLAI